METEPDENEEFEEVKEVKKKSPKKKRKNRKIPVTPRMLVPDGARAAGDKEIQEGISSAYLSWVKKNVDNNNIIYPDMLPRKDNWRILTDER